MTSTGVSVQAPSALKKLYNTLLVAGLDHTARTLEMKDPAARQEDLQCVRDEALMAALVHDQEVVELIRNLSPPAASSFEQENKKEGTTEVYTLEGMKKEEEEVNRLRNYVQDLESIQPMREEALKALQAVSMKDVNEIKAFKAPPSAIVDVLEATLIILGHDETNWNRARRLLADPQTLPNMIHFDSSTLTRGHCAEVEQILAAKANSFKPEVIGRVSSCMAAFALWVQAQVMSSKMERQVAPMRQQLEEHQATLEATRQHLGFLKANPNSGGSTESKSIATTAGGGRSEDTPSGPSSPIFTSLKAEGQPMNLTVAWYFAYGSNMSFEQCKVRLGKTYGRELLHLADHKLIFNKSSVQPGLAYANVAKVGPAPEGGGASKYNHEVYGVGYQLTCDQLLRMDHFEGVHFGQYTRERVQVTIASGPEKGTVVTAFIYLALSTVELKQQSNKDDADVDDEGDQILPSAEYLGRLTEGSDVLPEDYAAWVKQHKTSRIRSPRQDMRLRKEL